MSPRLTIIGLNFAPERTGIAPYTTSLASHLSKMGWTVKVITGFPHYPEWRIRADYKGRYRRATAGEAEVLHLRHYVPARPRLMNRLLMEVDFGLKVARVDWGDPDIVLFVSPALFSSGIARCTHRLRYPTARTVAWVQDLYGQGFEESHASVSLLSAPMRFFEAAFLASADKVFVIHDRLQRVVGTELKVPWENIEVVRNWTHIPVAGPVQRTAARRLFGWENEEIVVLHAGNMGRKQYLENVVEAARLAESRGSRTRFVLLGHGNQRHRLEVLGADVKNLEFMDPLPDTEFVSALSAADILLVNEMPGVRDMAVPSKLTSYFVAGRPVLAAVERDGTTAEEVHASGAGVVIPSGDPQALLQAVEILTADPVAASERGATGSRYATEHLSTDSAMKRWNAALLSLLRQPAES